MNETDFQVSTGNIFKDLDLKDAEELAARSDLLSELSHLIGKFMSEVLTLGLPDEQGATVLLAPTVKVPNGARLF